MTSEVPGPQMLPCPVLLWKVAHDWSWHFKCEVGPLPPLQSITNDTISTLNEDSRPSALCHRHSCLLRIRFFAYDDFTFCASRAEHPGCLPRPVKVRVYFHFKQLLYTQSTRNRRLPSGRAAMSTFSFVRFSLISIFAWFQFVMANPVLRVRDVYKPLYRCLSSYVLNFRMPVRWVPLPLGGKVCIQSLPFDFLISDCLIQKVVLALLFSLDGSTEEFLDHNVPTVLSALATWGTGIYPLHAFSHFNPLSWNF